MAVNPIPDGFHSVTPHMTVKDGGAAIEFYKKAFGAEEVFRMPGPDGKGVMHAEIQIGNSRVMLNEEWPMEGAPKAPGTLNGTCVTIHVYVEDADAAFKKAVDAGATGACPPMDAFWGDRFGKVVDPYGHHWSIAQHTKELTPEEIGKGAQEWFKEMGSCKQ